jgi:hypothetical protein
MDCHGQSLAQGLQTCRQAVGRDIPPCDAREIGVESGQLKNGLKMNYHFAGLLDRAIPFVIGLFVLLGGTIGLAIKLFASN